MMTSHQLVQEVNLEQDDSTAYKQTYRRLRHKYSGQQETEHYTEKWKWWILPHLATEGMEHKGSK